LAERRPGESIMVAAMPQEGTPDEGVLATMETVKEVINGIRGVRAQRNIPQRNELQLNVVNSTVDYKPVITKLGNLSNIETVNEKDPASATFMVGTQEFNIPLRENIDVEAEKAKLTKEIEYYEGFRRSVEGKLQNDRFINNAPAAVVENERKKLADALSRLATLKAALSAL
ncbi:MAG: valine--tRNA ligase, partial [Duncaniella sp.]|nr:valine--tRNA ligase [Duncaniella sp.]